MAQTLEARGDRCQRRTLRFDLDRDLLRAVAIGLRLRALEAEVLAQLVALLLELDARRFELRHRVHAFLQARARCRHSVLGAFS